MAGRDHFVGRGAEMARLGGAFEASAAGEGRIILVGGEPGIGKTRLIGELAAMALGAAAVVLTAGCEDGEWAPAFGAFAEAISAYARDAEPERLRRDLGVGAGAIARLAPVLRERLPDVPEPATLEPDEATVRFVAASKP